MGVKGKKFWQRNKGARSFNSLPTSVYLEKKPLLHSVILSIAVTSVQVYTDRFNKVAPLHYRGHGRNVPKGGIMLKVSHYLPTSFFTSP